MKRIFSSGTVTRRLLGQLSLFAILWIALSGAAIALITYRMEIRDFEQRFVEIQQGYVDVVRSALWEEDRETLQLALKGISQFPGIKSAHIDTPKGVVLQAGESTASPKIERTFPIFHTYNAETHSLGVLHVQGSSAFLRGKITRAIAVATAVQSITILFLFFIFSLLTYRNVVGRLLRITEYTSTLSPDTLDRPFVTDKAPRKPDELDNLADTINRIRENLFQAIERRKVVEEQIRRHQDELEKIVEQRTSLLKVANEQLQVEIAEKNRVNEEREKLLATLQEELQKVKKLSGLLPICASCKKIRDDDGYWNEVESYIRDRSEAEFSHGICPECIKKLYPDLKLPK